jgi:hypothetical protein
VNRFDALRISAPQSRTVGWVPYFLTASRLDELGTLVQLEHLLGGGGGQFDQNAAHLPVEQRALARQSLESLRRALTETIKGALRQAYGIAAARPADIDTAGFGDVTPLPTLWREQPLQRPAGATLSAALDGIIDQMLTLQFPDHPKFDSGDVEVRPADLRAMWDVVVKAAACPGGRLDPVEQNRRAVVRRLATPLRLGFVGDTHFVFDEANFGWRNTFVQRAAAEGQGSAIPVSALREWLAPLGLTREMGNLVITSFALLEDKQFQVRGATVQAREPSSISDDMVLVDPRLPSEHAWQTAGDRAAELFGVTAAQMRTAANVAALGRQIAAAAQARLTPCRSLVDVLGAHATTLALASDAPRAASASAGMAIVEALVGAADDVARVEALAAMQVPAEPQPLARSMASAADLVRGLRGHDWTTLDAVAREADGGDESAHGVLANLRKAAAAEELHSPLLPQLAAAHAAATQWLLGRRRPTPQPQPDGQTAALADPDAVTLDIDEQHLAEQIGSLQSSIAAALEQHPGKHVQITWRLM